MLTFLFRFLSNVTQQYTTINAMHMFVMMQRCLIDDRFCTNTYFCDVYRRCVSNVTGSVAELNAAY